MKRPDWLRLILAGICMFGNQVLFLVGVSFSPAHVASIWQVRVLQSVKRRQLSR